MAAGGLVFAPYPILALTARQRMTPDHLRGRVFAAYAAVVALGLPAGAALGAWMVTRGGVVAGVVGASTLSILQGHPKNRERFLGTPPSLRLACFPDRRVGLLAWWWPALRAVDPGAGSESSGPSGG
jgi:hypothetical protein